MGQNYFLENLGLGKIKSQTTRIYTPDFVGSLQNLSHMDNYQMIIEICSKTIQIFNFLSVCQKSILGLTHYNTNLVRVLHVRLLWTRWRYMLWHVHVHVVSDHQAHTENGGAIANLVLKISNTRYRVARQDIFNWKYFI